MRFTRFALALAMVAGFFSMGIGIAEAHYCPDGDPDSPECTDTPPSQEWRDNYVPLFDAPNRNDGSQTEYQRWRNEHGCTSQLCTWGDVSLSIMPADGDIGPMPEEAHVGVAGNHSLTEGAHQSEDHSCGHHHEACEGIHDRHGGTAYADICLAPNDGGGGSVHDPDSCDDGTSDTEVGIVIVDKNPCGTVPLGFPVPCMDEYHIVRPFDSDFTNQQLAATPGGVERIASDPNRYVCGNENSEKGEACAYVPADGSP